MNRYGYCGGDPVNFVDPSGLSPNDLTSTALGVLKSLFNSTLVGRGIQQGIDTYHSFIGYQEEFGTYTALNATLNPAYMAFEGWYEVGYGIGLTPVTLGRELSTGELWLSGIKGGIGTAGTIGVGFGGAALSRSFTAKESLISVANRVHGVLDTVAQNMRTTAVLETRSGMRLVAGGGRDLIPAQRAALKAGEVAVKLPKAHAEVTAITNANKLGESPLKIVVTRPFCAACRTTIKKSGGKIINDREANW